MRNYLRQHHVGLIALFLVLISGGSAYAAVATISANDIRANAVTTAAVRNGTIQGVDLNMATIDVSRVVARVRGTGDVALPLGGIDVPYPVTSASWTQAPDESVTNFVGRITFDGSGCLAGVSSIFLTFNVDGHQVAGAQNYVLPDATQQQFQVPVVGLFETGAVTPHVLTVSAVSSCDVGTVPTVLKSVALNVIGIR